jgi:site-specific DNA recombinase
MTARAVGYVRVSKAREEMISPELQVTAITDYCQRTGAKLVEVITDLDQTGRNFARVGVQSAIELVEAGGADLVVVWKWSRFGRNVKDCLVNIDRLEVAGGKLVAATEDFDDTPVGRFGRGQFLLMAQFESERIGEQWKEAQARRIRNGLPINGRPRYGYDYTKGTGYTPNPVTAPILKELYERYVAGDSPRLLANDMNRQGIPSPGGAIWLDSTVRQVLASGFAAGLLRVGINTGPRRDNNGGRFVEGAHEAIISMDTWERYLRKRANSATIGTRIRYPAHPFAGLIYCGSCGHPMYRANGIGRFMCGSRRRKAPCPHPAHTNMESVEAPVKAWLTTLSDQVNQRTEVVEKQRQGRSDARSRRKALGKEIVKVEASLIKLTKSYAEGIIPTDAYLATRDQLLGEKAAKSKQLDALSDDLEALAVPATRIAPDLLAEWDTLDHQGKRDILSALVARIEVHPKGRGFRPDIVVVPRWERSTPRN